MSLKDKGGKPGSESWKRSPPSRPGAIAASGTCWVWFAVPALGMFSNPDRVPRFKLRRFHCKYLDFCLPKTGRVEYGGCSPQR